MAGDAEGLQGPASPADPPDSPEGSDADAARRLKAALSRIASLPGLQVVGEHLQPARSASYGLWPDHLDDRLLAALHAGPFARPYTHQRDAIAALHDGSDVVLCTETASGKSLCFQVPIVDAVLREPGSRALMLFPTKALGRDQVTAMRQLVQSLEISSFGVGIYDGDTPPDERRAARTRAHAVATNPDMIHRGILPHHQRWARYLAGLRYVVLDELHVYRGLFGAHVANVLRRLWRLCDHYGSRPAVIACSASIANPGELAQALCGRPFEVIRTSGAPRGPKTFVVVNPKVVDPQTGVRRDYLKITRAVTAELLAARVQTLAFCRTRKAVELLTRYMQEDEPSPMLRSAVRGYRGGYLPERRREVEQALREGAAQLVATTHALELGIDIGGVDAVVLSGYPGSRAATVQRAGRAGRRLRPSAAILVSSSAPLDQFVATDPSFLFGQPPEHARVDRDNPEVLLPHLRCALHELGFVFPSEGAPDSGEAGSGQPVSDDHAATLGLRPGELREGLDWLAEQGAAHVDASPHEVCYLPVGPDSPAEHVDLRGSIEENFSVLDDGSGDVLAEVDFEDAPLYLHPGAIYPIEGRTHEVRRLDWDERKAYVRKAAVDYYTEAISHLRVRIVDPSSSGEPLVSQAGMPACGTGFAHVVRTVPGFKKIRFGTHENIGFGPIRLPDLELHTTAAYWPFPQTLAAQVCDPGRRCGMCIAGAHALAHVAAMMLMCDTGDLGYVVTAGHPSTFGDVIDPRRRPSTDTILAAGATPYVVLYDRHPGGAGLSITAHAMAGALLRRAASIVAGCGCERGCPTCMGPQGVGEGSDQDPVLRRDDVVVLLQAMAQAQESAACG